MFVKSDAASKETKTKSLLSVDPFSLFTSWKLLSIWLNDFGILLEIISCR